MGGESKEPEQVVKVLTGQTQMPQEDSKQVWRLEAKNDDLYVRVQEYAQQVRRRGNGELMNEPYLKNLLEALPALQAKIGTRENQGELFEYARASIAHLSQRRGPYPPKDKVVKLAVQMYKEKMHQIFGKLRIAGDESKQYYLAGPGMKGKDEMLRCVHDTSSKGAYALYQMLQLLKSDKNYIYIGTRNTGKINAKGLQIVDTYLIRQLCSNANGIHACSGYLLNELGSVEKGTKVFSLNNNAQNAVLTNMKERLRVIQYPLSVFSLSHNDTLKLESALNVLSSLEEAKVGNAVDFTGAENQGDLTGFMSQFIWKSFESDIEMTAKKIWEGDKTGVDLVQSEQETIAKVLQIKRKQFQLDVLMKNRAPFVKGDVNAKVNLLTDTKEVNNDAMVLVFIENLIECLGIENSLTGIIQFQNELCGMMLNRSFVSIETVTIHTTLYDHLSTMPYLSYLSFRIHEHPEVWCLIQIGLDANYQIWDARDNSHVIHGDVKIVDGTERQMEFGAHAEMVHLDKVVEILRGMKGVGTDEISSYGENYVHVFGIEETKFAVDHEMFSGKRLQLLSLADRGEERHIRATLNTPGGEGNSGRNADKRIARVFTTTYAKLDKTLSGTHGPNNADEKPWYKDGKNQIIGAGALALQIPQVSIPIAGGTLLQGGAVGSYVGSAIWGTGTTIAGIFGGTAALGAAGVGLAAGYFGPKLWNMFITKNKDHLGKNALFTLEEAHQTPKIVPVEKGKFTKEFPQWVVQKNNTKKCEMLFEFVNEYWSKAADNHVRKAFNEKHLGELQKSVDEYILKSIARPAIEELVRHACIKLGCKITDLDDSPEYLDPSFGQIIRQLSEGVCRVTVLYAQVNALTKALDSNWMELMSDTQNSNDSQGGSTLQEKIHVQIVKHLEAELTGATKQCKAYIDVYFQNVEDHLQKDASRDASRSRDEVRSTANATQNVVEQNMAQNLGDEKMNAQKGVI